MKTAAHDQTAIQNMFRVILLEPKESLNIGSVARAMMNMGFSDLVIVSSRPPDFYRAEITARKASSIFESSQVVSSLEEAVAPCTYVAGFSVRDSKNTPPVFLLNDWVGSIQQTISAANSRIGLLFGPEDTGLRYEHLPVCNAIVRIPSCEEYDSLNLAQAALIVFYAIASSHIHVRSAEQEETATCQQLAVLDRLIDEIAQKSEFCHEGTPENTSRLLHNLFRRPVMKYREMQIILGFFSRIAKSL